VKITGSIVTYNSENDIVKCISSILEHTGNLDFHLYVSDNASTDNTVKVINERFPRDKYPQLTVVRNNKNGGFGYGHNKILAHVKSDYHVFINPDIEFGTDVLTPLCAYLEQHKNAAMITPKIKNKDGSEQHLPKKNPRISYVILSKLPGLKFYRRRYTRQDENLCEPTGIDMCTGCFFVGRTDVLKEMRGFSTGYFMYFEDADLTRRVKKAGYDVIFYPDTWVYHDWHRDNTGSIRGIARFLKSMCRYFRIWGLR
jgi:GT2 family glycosyltransferase